MLAIRQALTQSYLFFQVRETNWNSKASVCLPELAGLRSISQRIYQYGKGGRRLTAARVVEVITWKGRAPIFQHPDEPSVSDVRLDLMLWKIGKPQAGRHNQSRYATYPCLTTALAGQ
jgi:hypothetical protein